jgi:hypothetical protein
MAVFLSASTLAMRASAGTNSPLIQLAVLALVFAVAGGLTGLWSRHWASVALPAGLISLLTVSLVAGASYLADGSDPALIWRYVPGLTGFLAAAVAAGVATGSWLVFRARRLAVTGRASEPAGEAAEQ